jgi:hypothetical protein
MSIFRQDNHSDGGWGSFVWYAQKLVENLEQLRKLLPAPQWRTRLYVDVSVPPEFIAYLMEEFDVEVGWVHHRRKGPYRDHLLASVRMLVLDDPSITRFVCLDCHDELADVKVQQVLKERFAVARARPHIYTTYWVSV